MKILALNCGSSSIKYKLFDFDKNHQLLVMGLAERIGQSTSCIRQVTENKQELEINKPLPDHQTALKTLYKSLTDFYEIAAVGHRVVHGGQKFRDSVLINKGVMRAIKKAAEFAPLHSRPNITGIEVSRGLLPDVPNVAVFDTAVHQTLKPKAFLYGLPIKFYQKKGIRKYGFHGINHGYVAQEAAKLLAKPFETLKIITCHLGNGCSITAFEQGRSIDTSMGLTPLEGLVMGTRCGDMDPSVVLHLIKVSGLSFDEIGDLLNKKSGLLGLCGKNDMRDIIKMAGNGDKNAQTAIEVFVYRVQKYIGAFVAALNGVDAIVFTGGIGENSPFIRKRALENFEYLNLNIDFSKNENNETIFSADDSRVCLMNIPANEELVIARQTYEILKKSVKKTSVYHEKT